MTRSHPPLPPGRDRAFSLIEVLTVIGIVTLLMSLALAGVHSVHESSKSSECSGRLRQLAIAANAYATTFREVMPPAVIFEATTAGVRSVAWDFISNPDGTIAPGPLWAFTDEPLAVQQCPSFVGSSTFGNDPFTGFNYNTSFIGSEGAYPSVDGSGQVVSGWANARRGLTAGQLRRPSQTALFGDGGWKGGANKFMRAPSASVEGELPLVYAGAQAFRHQGCTNVAWLDGHVSGVCQQCKGVHATPELLAGPMDFPRNGFLSDDDSAYDPR